MLLVLGGDTVVTKMQIRADDRHPPVDSLNQSAAMTLTIPASTSTVAGAITRTRDDRGLAAGVGPSATTLLMPTVAYGSGRCVSMIIMS